MCLFTILYGFHTAYTCIHVKVFIVFIYRVFIMLINNHKIPMMIIYVVSILMFVFKVSNMLIYKASSCLFIRFSLSCLFIHYIYSKGLYHAYY